MQTYTCLALRAIARPHDQAESGSQGEAAVSWRVDRYRNRGEAFMTIANVPQVPDVAVEAAPCGTRVADDGRWVAVAATQWRGEWRPRFHRLEAKMTLDDHLCAC